MGAAEWAGDGVTFEDVEEEGKQWKGRGRKKRKLKKREGKDLYKLLGLGNLRYLASEKEIRRGYQKAALKHHPDKAAQAGSDAEKAEIEERFKAIQAAYETLSDKAKRREYDSLDEFDDSLPSTCPERAEGREHRRWIERFNAKLRDKGKKEEARRL